MRGEAGRRWTTDDGRQTVETASRRRTDHLSMRAIARTRTWTTSGSGLHPRRLYVLGKSQPCLALLHQWERFPTAMGLPKSALAMTRPPEPPLVPPEERAR